MPSFRFKGFATASSVALTVAQGTRSASATVPSWGQAHAGTITVDVARSHDEIGPESVRFAVTGWTGFDTAGPTASGFDARMHDIDYFWSFGDPGSTFSPLRLLAHMKDANVGYGFAVSHVYDPGTYTWSCLAVERSSGKTAYAEGSLTVKDPDTEFSGAATLYVSNTSNFTNKPTGATEYTSLSAALDACKSLASGTKRRIMLRRGETHTFASGYNMNNGQWPSSLYIVAEDGAGAQPILNFTATGQLKLFDNMGSMSRPTVSDKIALLFKGITMQGPWDPTTESGLDATVTTDHCAMEWRGTGSDTLPNGFPEYILITDCTMKGFSCPIWSDTAGDVAEIATFHNSTITDWMDYGMYGVPKPSFSMLGVDFRQNANALGGCLKGIGTHNRHGPFRLSGNNLYFIMDGCDLASTTGWFQNEAGYNTQQPCGRLWWNYLNVDATSKGNIRRCIMEGGWPILQLADQNGAGGPLTCNTVIAQNILIATFMSTAHISTQYRGVTIENNIFLGPDSGSISGSLANGRAVTITAEGNATSATARIAVRHNSYINYRPSDYPVVEESLSQSDHVEEHNINHSPNATPAVTPFAPLSITNVIAPHFTGYHRRREIFTGTLSGNVANGASFTIPYTAGSFYSVAPGSSTAYQSTTPAHTNTLGTATYAFGASEVTVTNASGSTWTSGTAYTIQLERNVANLPPKQTEYGIPATGLGIPTPTTGSAAIGGAATTFPRFDALGNNRETIIDALTRTAATDGAVEVALES